MQALTIQNLYKTYPNGTTAVKNVDLTVEKGDFFALLGPNGAGKSSIIGITTSLITKSKGIIKVFGYDLDEAPQQAKSCIGLVPQEMNFPIFEKVIDVLIYQAGYYGVPQKTARTAAEYYLKKLDLWDQRDRSCIQLSGGMKRRLMIARALVHLVNEPKLLILDEPTAGVDIELRYTIWEFLKELNEQGTTIILTTHYLEEAEQLCKRVAIIDKGEIVENTTIESLLSRLDRETFICDLSNSINILPKDSPFVMRYIGPYQLEIDLMQTQTFNQLFEYLQEKMIQVVSMRQKTNRLESLFLNLTKN